MEKVRANEISQTIATQIGHRAFLMMGAKNICSTTDSKGRIALSFKIGRNGRGVSHIVVSYNEGADTYDVRFVQITTAAIKEKGIVEGIYCDSIKSIIETNTGVFLSL